MNAAGVKLALTDGLVRTLLAVTLPAPSDNILSAFSNNVFCKIQAIFQRFLKKFNYDLQGFSFNGVKHINRDSFFSYFCLFFSYGPF